MIHDLLHGELAAASTTMSFCLSALCKRSVVLLRCRHGDLALPGYQVMIAVAVAVIA